MQVLDNASPCLVLPKHLGHVTGHDRKVCGLAIGAVAEPEPPLDLLAPRFLLGHARHLGIGVDAHRGPASGCQQPCQRSGAAPEIQHPSGSEIVRQRGIEAVVVVVRVQVVVCGGEVQAGCSQPDAIRSRKGLTMRYATAS